MSIGTASSVMEIGKRLVELVDQGKNREAIEELYADDAVSVEAMDGGPNGRVIEGKLATLKASDAFFEMMEVHGGEVDGPYPHEDAFICFMSLDTTPKVGPMAGNRMQMKEACHYTVKDGKISRVAFYYHVDC